MVIITTGNTVGFVCFLQPNTFVFQDFCSCTAISFPHINYTYTHNYSLNSIALVNGTICMRAWMEDCLPLEDPECLLRTEISQNGTTAYDLLTFMTLVWSWWSVGGGFFTSPSELI